jgi:hypothetical protein
MPSPENNWHINIEGSSQNAFGGDGHTFNQKNGGEQPADLEKVLKLIVEGVPEEHRETIEKDVIEPLRTIAAEPAPETPRKQATVKAKIMEHLAKLEPFLPYIRKTAAAFADGALRSMGPPAGWIVGGLLEVIRDHRQ